MKILIFYISLFVIAAIAGVYYLIPPSLNQYKHIVIDCQIYDLEGKLLKKFQGSNCVFFNDGSFVKVNSSQDQLVRVNGKSEIKWNLNFQSKIKFLSLDSVQNILIVVYNKTGNKIIKVTKEGVIDASLDIGEKKPMSLRSVNFDIWQKGKRIALKNSYLLLNEDSPHHPLILDNKLGLTQFHFNPGQRKFQDLQFVSPEELIYFESGPMLLESFVPFIPAKKVGQWSSINFLNINDNSQKFFYVFKNQGPVKGGLQFLKKDLFLVTQQAENSDKPTNRKKISFFSESHGVFKMIEVENAAGNARTEDLSLFLKLNQMSELI